MSDTKRIHFLTGVDDLGAGYRCQRCGYATAFKVDMHEHRKGLLPECHLIKFRNWLSGLT